MSTCMVVITGASGSVYGLRLVEQLLFAGVEVTLVATQAGRQVMAYETGFALPDEDAAGALLRFLELAPTSGLRVAEPGDLFDRSASGTNGYQNPRL